MKRLELPTEILPVSSIVKEPTIVPDASGYYCWFFKRAPHILPVKNCSLVQGLPPLYIGIAKSSEKSKSSLRKRIYRNHINGRARQSTLRLSLGVILSEESGYFLRLHKNEKRKYWLASKGEAWLSSWMNENAFVGFVECCDPKAVEKALIQHYNPPLNINHSNNEFSKKLKSMRETQQKYARQSPPAF